MEKEQEVSKRRRQITKDGLLYTCLKQKVLYAILKYRSVPYLVCLANKWLLMILSL